MRPRGYLPPTRLRLARESSDTEAQDPPSTMASGAPPGASLRRAPSTAEAQADTENPGFVAASTLSLSEAVASLAESGRFSQAFPPYSVVRTALGTATSAEVPGPWQGDFARGIAGLRFIQAVTRDSKEGMTLQDLGRLFEELNSSRDAAMASPGRGGLGLALAALHAAGERPGGGSATPASAGAAAAPDGASAAAAASGAAAAADAASGSGAALPDQARLLAFEASLRALGVAGPHPSDTELSEGAAVAAVSSPAEVLARRARELLSRAASDPTSLEPLAPLLARAASVAACEALARGHRLGSLRADEDASCPLDAASAAGSLAVRRDGLFAHPALTGTAAVAAAAAGAAPAAAAGGRDDMLSVRDAVGLPRTEQALAALISRGAEEESLQLLLAGAHALLSAAEADPHRLMASKAGPTAARARAAAEDAATAAAGGPVPAGGERDPAGGWITDMAAALAAVASLQVVSPSEVADQAGQQLGTCSASSAVSTLRLAAGLPASPPPEEAASAASAPASPAAGDSSPASPLASKPTSSAPGSRSASAAETGITQTPSAGSAGGSASSPARTASAFIGARLVQLAGTMSLSQTTLRCQAGSGFGTVLVQGGTVRAPLEGTDQSLDSSPELDAAIALSHSKPIRRSRLFSTLPELPPSAQPRSAKLSAPDGLCNRWYFEATVDPQSSSRQTAVQIGWATSAIVTDINQGMGVGDDAASWSWCPCRAQLFAGSPKEAEERSHTPEADLFAPNAYGTRSLGKFTVGCVLDLERGDIRYIDSRGRDLGVAFRGVGEPGRGAGLAFFPAVSFSSGIVEFNIGADPSEPLRFLPPGCRPFAASMPWAESGCKPAPELSLLEAAARPGAWPTVADTSFAAAAPLPLPSLLGRRGAGQSQVAPMSSERAKGWHRALPVSPPCLHLTGEDRGSISMPRALFESTELHRNVVLEAMIHLIGSPSGASDPASYSSALFDAKPQGDVTSPRAASGLRELAAEPWAAVVSVGMPRLAAGAGSEAGTAEGFALIVTQRGELALVVCEARNHAGDAIPAGGAGLVAAVLTAPGAVPLGRWTTLGMSFSAGKVALLIDGEVAVSARLLAGSIICPSTLAGSDSAGSSADDSSTSSPPSNLVMRLGVGSRLCALGGCVSPPTDRPRESRDSPRGMGAFRSPRGPRGSPTAAEGAGESNFTCQFRASWASFRVWHADERGAKALAQVTCDRDPKLANSARKASKPGAESLGPKPVALLLFLDAAGNRVLDAAGRFAGIIDGSFMWGDSRPFAALRAAAQCASRQAAAAVYGSVYRQAIGAAAASRPSAEAAAVRVVAPPKWASMPCPALVAPASVAAARILLEAHSDSVSSSEAEALREQLAIASPAAQQRPCTPKGAATAMFVMLDRLASEARAADEDWRSSRRRTGGKSRRRLGAFMTHGAVAAPTQATFLQLRALAYRAASLIRAGAAGATASLELGLPAASAVVALFSVNASIAERLSRAMQDVSSAKGALSAADAASASSKSATGRMLSPGGSTHTAEEAMADSRSLARDAGMASELHDWTDTATVDGRLHSASRPPRGGASEAAASRMRRLYAAGARPTHEDWAAMVALTDALAACLDTKRAASDGDVFVPLLKGVCRGTAQLFRRHSVTMLRTPSLLRLTALRLLGLWTPPSAEARFTAEGVPLVALPASAAVREAVAVALLGSAADRLAPVQALVPSHPSPFRGTVPGTRSMSMQLRDSSPWPTRHALADLAVSASAGFAGNALSEVGPVSSSPSRRAGASGADARALMPILRGLVPAGELAMPFCSDRCSLFSKLPSEEHGSVVTMAGEEVAVAASAAGTEAGMGFHSAVSEEPLPLDRVTVLEFVVERTAPSVSPFFGISQWPIAEAAGPVRGEPKMSSLRELVCANAKGEVFAFGSLCGMLPGIEAGSVVTVVVDLRAGPAHPTGGAGDVLFSCNGSTARATGLRERMASVASNGNPFEGRFFACAGFQMRGASKGINAVSLGPATVFADPAAAAAEGAAAQSDAAATAGADDGSQAAQSLGAASAIVASLGWSLVKRLAAVELPLAGAPAPAEALASATGAAAAATSVAQPQDLRLTDHARAAALLTAAPRRWLRSSRGLPNAVPALGCEEADWPLPSQLLEDDQAAGRVRLAVVRLERDVACAKQAVAGARAGCMPPALGWAGAECDEDAAWSLDDADAGYDSDAEEERARSRRPSGGVVPGVPECWVALAPRLGDLVSSEACKKKSGAFEAVADDEPWLDSSAVRAFAAAAGQVLSGLAPCDPALYDGELSGGTPSAMSSLGDQARKWLASRRALGSASDAVSTREIASLGDLALLSQPISFADSLLRLSWPSRVSSGLNWNLWMNHGFFKCDTKEPLVDAALAASARSALAAVAKDVPAGLDGALISRVLEEESKATEAAMSASRRLNTSAASAEPVAWVELEDTRAKLAAARKAMLVEAFRCVSVVSPELAGIVPPPDTPSEADGVDAAVKDSGGAPKASVVSVPMLRFDARGLGSTNSPQMRMAMGGRQLVQASKGWGMSRASVPLRPDSGVHTWFIRVDASSSHMHVFVGVATAEHGTTKHLGADAGEGVGVLISGDVYANNGKQRSGAFEGGSHRFGPGSVLAVSFDTRNGMLYVWDPRNPSTLDSWGSCWEDFDSMREWFPAAAMNYEGDQLTFLGFGPVLPSDAFDEQSVLPTTTSPVSLAEQQATNAAWRGVECNAKALTCGEAAKGDPELAASGSAPESEGRPNAKAALAKLDALLAQHNLVSPGEKPELPKPPGLPQSPRPFCESTVAALECSLAWVSSIATALAEGGGDASSALRARPGVAEALLSIFSAPVAAALLAIGEGATRLDDSAGPLLRRAIAACAGALPPLTAARRAAALVDSGTAFSGRRSDAQRGPAFGVACPTDLLHLAEATLARLAGRLSLAMARVRPAERKRASASPRSPAAASLAQEASESKQDMAAQPEAESKDDGATPGDVAATPIADSAEAAKAARQTTVFGDSDASDRSKRRADQWASSGLMQGGLRPDTPCLSDAERERAAFLSSLVACKGDGGALAEWLSDVVHHNSARALSKAGKQVRRGARALVAASLYHLGLVPLAMRAGRAAAAGKATTATKACPALAHVWQSTYVDTIVWAAETPERDAEAGLVGARLRKRASLLTDSLWPAWGAGEADPAARAAAAAAAESRLDAVSAQAMEASGMPIWSADGWAAARAAGPGAGDAKGDAMGLGEPHWESTCRAVFAFAVGTVDQDGLVVRLAERRRCAIVRGEGLAAAARLLRRGVLPSLADEPSAFGRSRTLAVRASLVSALPAMLGAPEPKTSGPKGGRDPATEDSLGDGAEPWGTAEAARGQRVSRLGLDHVEGCGSDAEAVVVSGRCALLSAVCAELAVAASDVEEATAQAAEAAASCATPSAVLGVDGLSPGAATIGDAPEFGLDTAASSLSQPAVPATASLGLTAMALRCIARPLHRTEHACLDHGQVCSSIGRLMAAAAAATRLSEAAAADLRSRLGRMLDSCERAGLASTSSGAKKPSGPSTGAGGSPAAAESASMSGSDSGSDDAGAKVKAALLEHQTLETQALIFHVADLMLCAKEASAVQLAAMKTLALVSTEVAASPTRAVEASLAAVEATAEEWRMFRNSGAPLLSLALPSRRCPVVGEALLATRASDPPPAAAAALGASGSASAALVSGPGLTASRSSAKADSASLPLGWIGADQVAEAGARAEAPFLDATVISQSTKLLVVLSGSSACLRLLSRPEWVRPILTLFAVGPASVQRRAGRLLRAILPAVAPDGSDALDVGGLLRKGQSGSPAPIVDLLLDMAAAAATPGAGRVLLTGPVAASMAAPERRAQTLSECLATLRVLVDTPSWRSVVVERLSAAMDVQVVGTADRDPVAEVALAAMAAPDGAVAEDLRQLSADFFGSAEFAASVAQSGLASRALALAALGVAGGLAEELRPGGPCLVSAEGMRVASPANAKDAKSQLSYFSLRGREPERLFDGRAGRDGGRSKPDTGHASAAKGWVVELPLTSSGDSSQAVAVVAVEPAHDDASSGSEGGPAERTLLVVPVALVTPLPLVPPSVATLPASLAATVMQSAVLAASQEPGDMARAGLDDAVSAAEALVAAGTHSAHATEKAAATAAAKQACWDPALCAGGSLTAAGAALVSESDDCRGALAPVLQQGSESAWELVVTMNDQEPSRGIAAVVGIFDCLSGGGSAPRMPSLSSNPPQWSLSSAEGATSRPSAASGRSLAFGPGDALRLVYDAKDGSVRAWVWRKSGARQRASDGSGSRPAPVPSRRSKRSAGPSASPLHIPVDPTPEEFAAEPWCGDAGSTLFTGVGGPGLRFGAALSGGSGTLRVKRLRRIDRQGLEEALAAADPASSTQSKPATAKEARELRAKERAARRAKALCQIQAHRSKWTAQVAASAELAARPRPDASADTTAAEEVPTSGAEAEAQAASLAALLSLAAQGGKLDRAIDAMLSAAALRALSRILLVPAAAARFLANGGAAGGGSDAEAAVDARCALLRRAMRMSPSSRGLADATNLELRMAAEAAVSDAALSATSLTAYTRVLAGGLPRAPPGEALAEDEVEALARGEAGDAAGASDAAGAVAGSAESPARRWDEAALLPWRSATAAPASTATAAAAAARSSSATMAAAVDALFAPESAAGAAGFPLGNMAPPSAASPYSAEVPVPATRSPPSAAVSLHAALGMPSSEQPPAPPGPGRGGMPGMPGMEEAIANFVAMGIDEDRARVALRHAPNPTVEAAMEWLFAHEAEIDNILEAEAAMPDPPAQPPAAANLFGDAAAMAESAAATEQALLQQLQAAAQSAPHAMRGAQPGRIADLLASGADMSAVMAAVVDAAATESDADGAGERSESESEQSEDEMADDLEVEEEDEDEGGGGGSSALDAAARYFADDRPCSGRRRQRARRSRNKDFDWEAGGAGAGDAAATPEELARASLAARKRCLGGAVSEAGLRQTLSKRAAAAGPGDVLDGLRTTAAEAASVYARRCFLLLLLQWRAAAPRGRNARPPSLSVASLIGPSFELAGEDAAVVRASLGSLPSARALLLAHGSGVLPAASPPLNLAASSASFIAASAAVPSAAGTLVSAAARGQSGPGGSRQAATARVDAGLFASEPLAPALFEDDARRGMAAMAKVPELTAAEALAILFRLELTRGAVLDWGMDVALQATGAAAASSRRNGSISFRSAGGSSSTSLAAVGLGLVPSSSGDGPASSTGLGGAEGFFGADAPSSSEALSASLAMAAPALFRLPSSGPGGAASSGPVSGLAASGAGSLPGKPAGALAAALASMDPPSLSAALRPQLADALEAAEGSDDLAEVLADMVGDQLSQAALRRHREAKWSASASLSLADTAVARSPALGFVRWLTLLLLDAASIRPAASSSSSSSSRHAGQAKVALRDAERSEATASELFRAWSSGLRSASVALKEQAMQQLGEIIERIRLLSLSCPELRPDWAVLLSLVPAARIEALAARRLDSEMEDWPRTSRYLQSLVEFASVLRFADSGAAEADQRGARRSLLIECPASPPDPFPTLALDSTGRSRRRGGGGWGEGGEGGGGGGKAPMGRRGRPDDDSEDIAETAIDFDDASMASLLKAAEGKAAEDGSGSIATATRSFRLSASSSRRRAVKHKAEGEAASGEGTGASAGAADSEPRGGPRSLACAMPDHGACQVLLECGDDAPSRFARAMGIVGPSGQGVAFEYEAPPGVWVHLALICSEDGRVRLLVNGQSAGAPIQCPGGEMYPPVHSLGARRDAAEADILEARLWRTCRSRAEVVRDLRSPLAISRPSSLLWGLWLMREGRGSYVEDVTGQHDRCYGDNVAWDVEACPPLPLPADELLREVAAQAEAAHAAGDEVKAAAAAAQASLQGEARSGLVSALGQAPGASWRGHAGVLTREAVSGLNAKWGEEQRLATHLAFEPAGAGSAWREAAVDFAAAKAVRAALEAGSDVEPWALARVDPAMRADFARSGGALPGAPTPEADSKDAAGEHAERESKTSFPADLASSAPAPAMPAPKSAWVAGELELPECLVRCRVVGTLTFAKPPAPKGAQGDPWAAQDGDAVAAMAVRACEGDATGTALNGKLELIVAELLEGDPEAHPYLLGTSFSATVRGEVVKGQWSALVRCAPTLPPQPGAMRFWPRATDGVLSPASGVVTRGSGPSGWRTVVASWVPPELHLEGDEAADRASAALVDAISTGDMAAAEAASVAAADAAVRCIAEDPAILAPATAESRSASALAAAAARPRPVVRRLRASEVT
ncbi:hypothetical protein FNF31_01312 [Cafeteria roenbergensis]|uniref:B30.2/SPRY domain-containing protein n=1 Tax=Cafeteria roenbergensis TaxID=33653 RepID=A0A5A8DPB1_CAFRO|nr:hypothetical protein FNF31_01312 [Cafeteria roenbergensis]